MLGRPFGLGRPFSVATKSILDSELRDFHFQIASQFAMIAPLRSHRTVGCWQRSRLGVSCALASQTQNAGSEIHSRILDGDGRVCQRSVGTPEFLYALRKKPCWNAPGNWNFFSNPPKETAITPFWMLCTIPVRASMLALIWLPFLVIGQIKH